MERIGFPANCVDMPTLVSLLEGLTDELLIRNLSNVSTTSQSPRLQKQDLAVLFSRFERIEIDTSVIAQYPSTRLKTKVRRLCVASDTHNFFIPLLMAIPKSVTHLCMKNPTFSTNNLHFDAEQLRQQKYKTEQVQALTLFGFENNLKQVSNLVNRLLFPALQKLTLVTNQKQTHAANNIERDLRKLLKTEIVDKNKIVITSIFNADPYFVFV